MTTTGDHDALQLIAAMQLPTSSQGVDVCLAALSVLNDEVRDVYAAAAHRGVDAVEVAAMVEQIRKFQARDAAAADQLSEWDVLLRTSGTASVSEPPLSTAPPTVGALGVATGARGVAQPFLTSTSFSHATLTHASGAVGALLSSVDPLSESLDTTPIASQLQSQVLFSNLQANGGGGGACGGGACGGGACGGGACGGDACGGDEHGLIGSAKPAAARPLYSTHEANDLLNLLLQEEQHEEGPHGEEQHAAGAAATPEQLGEGFASHEQLLMRMAPPFAVTSTSQTPLLSPPPASSSFDANRCSHAQSPGAPASRLPSADESREGAPHAAAAFAIPPFRARGAPSVTAATPSHTDTAAASDAQLHALAAQPPPQPQPPQPPHHLLLLDQSRRAPCAAAGFDAVSRAQPWSSPLMQTHRFAPFGAADARSGSSLLQTHRFAPFGNGAADAHPAGTAAFWALRPDVRAALEHSQQQQRHQQRAHQEDASYPTAAAFRGEEPQRALTPAYGMAAALAAQPAGPMVASPLQSMRALQIMQQQAQPAVPRPSAVEVETLFRQWQAVASQVLERARERAAHWELQPKLPSHRSCCVGCGASKLGHKRSGMHSKCRETLCHCGVHRLLHPAPLGSGPECRGEWRDLLAQSGLAERKSASVQPPPPPPMQMLLPMPPPTSSAAPEVPLWPRWGMFGRQVAGPADDALALGRSDDAQTFMSAWAGEDVHNWPPGL